MLSQGERVGRRKWGGSRAAVKKIILRSKYMKFARAVIFHREIRILIMNARWPLLGMHHKVVESDHFEIGIVDEFPCSQQFERIAVPQPVLDDIRCAAISQNPKSYIPNPKSKMFPRPCVALLGKITFFGIFSKKGVHGRKFPLIRV